jgi:hypothetical protein
MAQAVRESRQAARPVCLQYCARECLPSPPSATFAAIDGICSAIGASRPRRSSALPQLGGGSPCRNLAPPASLLASQDRGGTATPSRSRLHEASWRPGESRKDIPYVQRAVIPRSGSTSTCRYFWLAAHPAGVILTWRCCSVSTRSARPFSNTETSARSTTRVCNPRKRHAPRT